MFGYHLTGSTGTLFLFGIVVGAVALLALSVLLASARRTAGRGRDARSAVARFQREMAFINRDRGTRLEHQPASATPSRSRPAIAKLCDADTTLFSRCRRNSNPVHTDGRDQ